MPANGTRVTVRELYELIEKMREESRQDRAAGTAEIKKLIADTQQRNDEKFAALDECIADMRTEIYGRDDKPGIKGALIDLSQKIKGLESRDWKMLMTSLAAAVVAYAAGQLGMNK